MHILLMVVLLIFSSVYSEDITRRLELYVEEEMADESEEFKKELKRCFKVASRYSKSPELEKILEKEGCRPVFEKYEKIIDKATQRYSEELHKNFEQVEKEYREKIASSIKQKVQAGVKKFKIGNIKFVFIQIPVDPEEYEIYEAKVNGKNSIFPGCSTDTDIIAFLPVSTEKPFKLTVYYGKKIPPWKLEKVLEGKEKLNMDSVYKIDVNINGGNFQEFTVAEEEKNGLYIYRLPVPAVEAYALYKNTNTRKPFPKFQMDNPCSKEKLFLRRRPDSVYINLIVEKNGYIEEKSFKVWERDDNSN
ncbi:hypothetical protein [Persephonella sp.]